MNLDEKTIDELKVIGFDIDQQIKISQQNYQAVIQVLNKKLEEESKQPTPQVDGGLGYSGEQLEKMK